MARRSAGGWFLNIIDAVARIQLVWGAVLFIGPILAAATTGIFGYLEWEPVMWIITASALVLFAGLASSYQILGLRQFITSMGKLRYSNTMVACDLKEVKPGKTRAISRHVIEHRQIDKMQIGVMLYNSAHFEISAYIESANTSMGGESPPRTDFPKPAATILPGQTVFMLDEAIDMKGRACGNVQGRLEMNIRYGAPHREKYDLSFMGRVEVHMRNTGEMTGHYTIWDTESGVAHPNS